MYIIYISALAITPLFSIRTHHPMVISLIKLITVVCPSSEKSEGRFFRQPLTLQIPRQQNL